jgi:outer membrane receptor for ferrienterochelin and colicin
VNRLYWSFLLLLLSPFVWGQKIEVKGVVKDQSGERLPQAFVIILPDSITVPSNASGHFSIKVLPGKKDIRVSYIGFENKQLSVNLRKDTTIHMIMISKVSALQEVVVTGERNFQAETFESNRTSTHLLTQDIIHAIPVLGGEADLIKTLQLLPGTIRGVEGSSDLFVRGGAADQNLVLLDGAPIYNTSHLFGFVSVFNPDVLDRVEAINGGFPAEYGGRLSSILDVQTTSTIPSRTRISGDIGVIASRLYLEQPIKKDKASFWIAARRTYVDQVVKAIGTDELPYYFYDLNGKIILRPTSRDLIEFAHYSGEDILDIFRDRNNDGNGYLSSYQSGNNSQSLNWKRTLPEDWSASISLIRSKYNYNILNSFEENELLAVSDIEDYGTRFIVQKDSVGKSGTFKTGFDWTRHAVSPNVINTAGSIAELLQSSSSEGRVANEFGLHAQYEWSPAPRWMLNTGIRFSSAVVGSRFYFNPEPRVSARYSLNETEALKFSYSRMVQYLHRISNSAITSPTDIWYPVTDDIKPQTSHQVAVGWQKTFADRKILLSVETYYKDMRQLIGYEEGTNLFLNTDFQSKLIQGKGNAYGLEVLLRKDVGKFSGWISYTLSWSNRQFDEVNNGKWFPSRYDRRHNGAVVTQYSLSKRFAVSVVWEFISGARFTPVVGQYILFAPTLSGVDLIPIYSGLNQVRLADSHRLDAGIKFKSKPDRKFQWEIFAGVYNAYNRANPIGITITQDDTTGELKYQQPGLFGLIPFVSYGFEL